jgi:hypothetical protein
MFIKPDTALSSAEGAPETGVCPHCGQRFELSDVGNLPYHVPPPDSESEAG